jgi:hypothetical protein
MYYSLHVKTAPLPPAFSSGVFGLFEKTFELSIFRVDLISSFSSYHEITSDLTCFANEFVSSKSQSLNS